MTPSFRWSSERNRCAVRGAKYVENEAKMRIFFFNLKVHILAQKMSIYIMGVSPIARKLWNPRFWPPEGPKIAHFGDLEGTHCITKNAFDPKLCQISWTGRILAYDNFPRRLRYLPTPLVSPLRTGGVIKSLSKSDILTWRFPQVVEWFRTRDDP